jgi:hypothetical protein
MSVTRKRVIRISVYGSLAFVILFILAHPYSRQALIGPKVDGLPLRLWQDNFRSHARGHQQPTVAMQLLGWFGIHPGAGMSGLPGGNGSMLIVMRSLIDDPDPRVRRSIAHRLGWSFFVREKCVPPLLRLLDDADTEVRLVAAISLNNYVPPNEPAAVPSLVRLLDDSDPRCRVRAAQLLWNMGEKKAPDMIALLGPAMKDPDAKVRYQAFVVLGQMGPAASNLFGEIAAAATGDLNSSVRWQATVALGTLGPPAIPLLLKALRDVESQCRESAARALGSMGADAIDCAPALEALLKDANYDVRDAAAKALEKIDPERFPERADGPE